MNSQKKQRCYIYTRVSTQMQVEKYSLDAQRERLQREADHRGMTIAAEFSDEGKSGKNTTGRPQFTEMLRRIQTGNPDGVCYVLVFKLSRFGRNAADVLYNLQLMQDYGVNLLCVEDGIDSASAAGKILFPVLAGVAELERENIRAQTMAGRWQKAREGKWNGGQAPYGYRLEKDTLAIEESEADLIRVIFDKFAHTDLGYSGVAKWMNANGYQKNTRQNNLYSRITESFVKAVLDNPVYIGKIVYGRHKNEKIEGTRNEYHSVKQTDYELFDGKHEAIIPDDLWQKVRFKRTLTGIKTEKRHGPKNIHLLSGLIRCPDCGAPMFGAVQRKLKKDGSGEFYSDMRYYICKNTKIAAGRKCSYSHHVRQEVLDAQVRAVLREALQNMDFTGRVLAAVGSHDNLDTMNAELDSLQAVRKKEIRQKTKLLSKIAELDADDDLYDSMYEDLHSVLRQRAQSIAELDDKIEQVTMAIHNAGTQQLTAERVRTIIGTIFDMMDIMPAEDERTIMHALVDSIQIYPKALPNGLILKSIRFKVPLEWDGLDSRVIGIDLDDNDDGDDSSGDPPSGGGPSPDRDSPFGGSPHPNETKTPDSDPFLVENSLPNQTIVPELSVTKNSAPLRGFLVTASRFKIVRVQRGSS